MLRTLAELIREGSKIHPQGFKTFFADGKSCAYGAAAFAASGNGHLYSLFLHGRFTARNSVADCPDCDDKTMSNIGLVTHLNDEHEWKREDIATWVDTWWVQPFCNVPKERPWLK